MKPSLLLPTLLVATTALVATVVVFVEDRQEHLAGGNVVTEGAQPIAVVDRKAGYGGKPVARDSASTPLFPVDSFPQDPVQTREVSYPQWEVTI